MPWDVLVIGGGPAGLSAATMLGRCRRTTLLVDAGRPRNARARVIHGFLTRDGVIGPSAFAAIARRQLARYDSVVRHEGVVTALRRQGGTFIASVRGLGRVSARRVIVATGLVDRLPDLPGLDPLYGTSVHHCPHCDAWEWRDQPLAAIGPGHVGAALAAGLTRWSSDVVWCTTDPRPARADRARAESVGVRVETRSIVELVGRRGRLRAIAFTTGVPLARSAAFVTTSTSQGCDLPKRMGCAMAEEVVDAGRRGESGVPGVFVVGDAARDAQLVIVAAAEGAKAALAVDRELFAESLARLGRRQAPRRPRAARPSR